MRRNRYGIAGTVAVIATGVLATACGGGTAATSAPSPPGQLAGTATSVLMLVVLRLIPRELVATADGERNPEVEAEVLAEISPAVSVGGAARR